MQKPVNTKTRGRIVERALELFRESGYDSVTIQQICKYAGITKSTFYYHFPSKESLIEEYTEQVSQTTQDHFSDILAMESSMQQLWAVFDSHTKKNNDYGFTIVGQVFRARLSTCDESDFPHYLSFFNTVSTLIEKAQKSGEIQNLSPAAEIAESLYYGSRGIAYSWASCQGGFSLEEKFQTLFNTLLLPTADHRINIKGK